MRSQDEILKEIQEQKDRLEKATSENDNVQANVYLGPMDVITPWTESGTDMMFARERIEELTLELGKTVIRERSR